MGARRLAEMTREVEMLRVIDVLVAKEHDLPAVERGAYGRHQRRC